MKRNPAQADIYNPTQYGVVGAERNKGTCRDLKTLVLSSLNKLCVFHKDFP
jgi:hypothetical protein